MFEPAIGEKVYLHRPGGSQNKEQPEVAFVTHVNTDGTVNVAGFTKHGEHFSMLNLALGEGGNLPAKGDCAYAVDSYKKPEKGVAAGSKLRIGGPAMEAKMPPPQTLRI
jgi:hypothetical protein